ncbi:sigma-54 interaction domain-containing protein [Desulforhopalus singaporensis]|uniref:Arginine utilization regulatory protein n=1 Tax=Desulforhopalus singaporensis TaxID=91360 RepID=A0A1H0U299_9BACT|nr:sigma 54-interacting transcriptional regulator [Desulforhopalus singaporensis]SDP60432.1 arginine utilization regulatory protein [Desulforhopalus singaporensis]
MIPQQTDPQFPAQILDIGYEDFLPLFNGFSEGILIADHSGIIIYYNPAMALIDELAPAEVVGKKVVDIYDLEAENSMIMQCLASQSPIIDRSMLYRTVRGKVANTIHTVFPLFRQKRLQGAICMVREYNILKETISSVSIPRHKQMRANETRFDFASIIGGNSDFIKAVTCAKMAANTPSPVMLYGETGTGKELFAQAIHNRSKRKDKHYTAINCAAIPENLLEGLLFGTVRGAFTGSCERMGLFERSNGGTLFLDELNSMPISLQAKILRVIQEQKVRRLGSLEEARIDVKIISSINQDPRKAITAKRLRPDLFYRLGVVLISIPPLRKRKDDISLLVHHFLEKHSIALNRKVTDVSTNLSSLLSGYDWPGNVRELEHVIEGAINLVGSSPTLTQRHLQSHVTAFLQQDGTSSGSSPELKAAASSYPLKNLEKHFSRLRSHDKVLGRNNRKGLPDLQADHEKIVLTEALAAYQGHVTKAAKAIGISRQLFNYKMKKHNICRNDFVL